MTPALRRTAAHAAGLGLVCALLASAQTGPAAAEPAPPTPDCGDAPTQAAMNRCAFADFEAASADLAVQQRSLRARLPPPQQDRLRRLQSAWTAWRTAACRFEAGPAAGGSVHDFVYWTCAARLTREQAARLAAEGTCVEGDVSCTVPQR